MSDASPEPIPLPERPSKGLHRGLASSPTPRTSGFRIEAGMTLGDFTLIQLLGRGGMGEVWEAEQGSLSRRVALKLLLPERVDERGLDFFAREARAGGRLSHPGIVAIHGTGENEGMYWIAMELVPEACDLRRSLEALREEEDVPEQYYRSVAEFVAQVADALEVAHAAGVIHRDLKPANILVTPDDRPKVSDFGLAKLVDEHSLSIAGDLVGTYFYMSPEQVAAKRIGIDHRTDVFSLGVVLYEMLTLARPFVGDTTEQVAHKILMVDPPAPDELRSKVPRDLSVICGKALEKNPDVRYGSMAELAADLRRHLGHEPIHARPPTVGQRLVKWAKRNPTVSAAAGVAGVAASIIAWLGLVALDQADQARRGKASAEAALEQVEVERENTRAALGVAEDERATARANAYAANIFGASAALDVGNVPDAVRRLRACPEELRGWEFDYLDLMADPSLLQLEGHGGPVSSVAWDPAGARIASCSADGSIRIWDGINGEALEVLTSGSHGAPLHLAWEPAGERLVSGHVDGSVLLWSLKTGGSFRELGSHGMTLSGLDWSSDGRRVLSSDWGGSVRVWNLLTSELALELEPEGGGVTSASFDPTAGRIATVGSDEKLRVWEAQTGELLLNAFTAQQYASHAWSPDGARIAVAGVGGGLCLYDSTTGQQLKKVQAHDFAVTSVAWSPSGAWLLTSSTDKLICVWDARTCELLRKMHGHVDSVNCVDWDPSGTRIASGSIDRSVRVWDYATAEPVAEVPEGTSLLRKAHWESTGERFASAGSDRHLWIWDGRTGEPLQRLQGHRGSVMSVAWSPDGTRLASSATDRTLRIWDTETFEVLRILEGHENTVFALAWSSDGTRLVSGAAGGLLRLWDPIAGICLQELEGHGDDVFSLEWEPGGSRILSGAQDGTIRIWDGETGAQLGDPLGHGDWVIAVGWSPDGQRFASGASDGTLRVWEAESRQVLHIFSGHSGRIHALDWHPAGSRILTGSEDRTLRVWDVDGLRMLQVLHGHSHYVHDVAWHPSGARALSVARDGTLRIWESRLQDALGVWRVAARSRAARTLVRDLFEEHLLLDQVLEVLREDPSIGKELRAQAIQVASEWVPHEASTLNSWAWSLVSPDRPDPDTDVVRGLKLARTAVALEPEGWKLHDTLAWALLANGLPEEAVAASRAALDLAPTRLKERYLGHLTRVTEAAAQASGSSDGD